MLKPASLFVGMRYAKLAKGNGFISFISFFSIAGIALGMIALITVTSVMNGFENRLKSSMLQFVPHIVLDLPQSTNINETDLLHDPMVKSVSPFLSNEGLIVSNKSLQAVPILGVDKQGLNPINNLLSEQLANALQENKYSVAIARTLANDLKAKQGDKVRLMLPSVTSYTPVGRLPSQRLFTVIGIIDKADLNGPIVITSNQSLLRLNRIKPNDFSSIAVFLDDPFRLDEFEAKYASISNYKISDWRDTQGSLFSAVAMEKRIMSLLLGLIILVAVFNILSTLIMMVSEKRSEIAILQTIGMSPLGILQVFMVQGLFNGFVGSVLGVGLGLMVAHNINPLLSLLGMNLLGGMRLPIAVSELQVISIFSMSILMSFLATFYPARRAAKIAPAQVLRYE
jgi:lipoprotein-releasing system permease protein